MKAPILVIALAAGCAGPKDSDGLAQRIRELETQVDALKMAPPPAPAQKPKRPRPDDRVAPAPDPETVSRIAQLEGQVRILQRTLDEAWGELDRLLFGDVRALDARKPNWLRITLKPDVSYSVPVTRDHPTDAADDTARVTWVIGMEITEPFTRKLLETAKSIRKAYGRELRIVYKHNVVHDFGAASAVALCAANRQGKFAEALEVLGKVSMQERNEMRITGLRSALHFLDRTQFDADITGGCRKHVRDDHLFAIQFGLGAVPYSFINGRYIAGAQPEEALRKLIDEELARANAELGGRSSKGYYDKLVRRGAKP
jgi:protein-disulfide isomerase